MSQEQHLLAAGIQAENARTEGRPDTSRGGNPSQIRRAIVTAVNGNGTYNITLQGAAGGSTEVANVPSWGGTFAVNARVSVVIDPSRAVPWIMGGAGGSGDGETIIVVPTAYGG